MKRQSRPVAHTSLAVEVMEGAGVMVKRVLPSTSIAYEQVDPFLLLDDASIKPDDPGFPRHPHRGFEIVTYLLAGAFKHADSTGRESTVHKGGLQKITAGKGVWHGEMPDAEGGAGRGLQLWINLSRADKQVAPDYQLVEVEDVPVVDLPGARVRLLAGKGGAVALRSPSMYLDVVIDAEGTFTWDIPAEFNGLVYVLEGRGEVGADRTEAQVGGLLVLGKGDMLEARAGETGLRFVLCAGRPHGEPVFWRGPFVD